LSASTHADTHIMPVPGSVSATWLECRWVTWETLHACVHECELVIKRHESPGLKPTGVTQRRREHQRHNFPQIQGNRKHTKLLPRV